MISKKLILGLGILLILMGCFQVPVHSAAVTSFTTGKEVDLLMGRAGHNTSLEIRLPYGATVNSFTLRVNPQKSVYIYATAMYGSRRQDSRLMAYSSDGNVFMKNSRGNYYYRADEKIEEFLQYPGYTWEQVKGCGGYWDSRTMVYYEDGRVGYGTAWEWSNASRYLYYWWVYPGKSITDVKAIAQGYYSDLHMYYTNGQHSWGWNWQWHSANRYINSWTQKAGRNVNDLVGCASNHYNGALCAYYKDGTVDYHTSWMEMSDSTKGTENVILYDGYALNQEIPSEVKFDIGADGNFEFVNLAIVENSAFTVESASIVSALNNRVQNYPEGKGDAYIPLLIEANAAAKFEITNLEIMYTLADDANTIGAATSTFNGMREREAKFDGNTTVNTDVFFEIPSNAQITYASLDLTTQMDSDILGIGIYGNGTAGDNRAMAYTKDGFILYAFAGENINISSPYQTTWYHYAGYAVEDVVKCAIPARSNGMSLYKDGFIGRGNWNSHTWYLNEFMYYPGYTFLDVAGMASKYDGRTVLFYKDGTLSFSDAGMWSDASYYSDTWKYHPDFDMSSIIDCGYKEARGYKDQLHVYHKSGKISFGRVSKWKESDQEIADWSILGGFSAGYYSDTIGIDIGGDGDIDNLVKFNEIDYDEQEIFHDDFSGDGMDIFARWSTLGIHASQYLTMEKNTVQTPLMFQSEDKWCMKKITSEAGTDGAYTTQKYNDSYVVDMKMYLPTGKVGYILYFNAQENVSTEFLAKFTRTTAQTVEVELSSQGVPSVTVDAPANDSGFWDQFKVEVDGKAAKISAYVNNVSIVSTSFAGSFDVTQEVRCGWSGDVKVADFKLGKANTEPSRTYTWENKMEDTTELNLAKIIQKYLTGDENFIQKIPVNLESAVKGTVSISNLNVKYYLPPTRPSILDPIGENTDSGWSEDLNKTLLGIPNTYEVSWTVSQSDYTNQVYYDVDYSADGGKKWVNLDPADDNPPDQNITSAGSIDSLVLPTADMVFKMDFEGGVIPKDGNGTTGVYTIATNTGITINPDGISGECATFNGSSSVIAITKHAELNAAAEHYTVSLWIKPEVNNEYWTGVIGKPGRNYAFYLGYSDRANGGYVHHRFHTGASTNDGNNDTTVGAIAMNAWNHVVLVHDGTTAFTYINGSEVASKVTSPPVANDTNLIIGGNPDSATGAGNYFQGSIDEIRIYKRALSSLEVRSLYDVNLFQENIVFEEDFEADLNKWNIKSGVWINAGGFARSSSGWFTTMYIDCKQSEGVWEMDLKKTHGTFIWFICNSGRFYWWQCEGYVLWIYGGAVRLSSCYDISSHVYLYTKSETLDEAWAHYKIVREKSMFKVYQDGVLSGYGSNSYTYDNRYFGISSYYTENTGFDNIKIYSYTAVDGSSVCNYKWDTASPSVENYGGAEGDLRPPGTNEGMLRIRSYYKLGGYSSYAYNKFAFSINHPPKLKGDVSDGYVDITYDTLFPSSTSIYKAEAVEWDNIDSLIEDPKYNIVWEVDSSGTGTTVEAKRGYSVTPDEMTLDFESSSAKISKGSKIYVKIYPVDDNGIGPEYYGELMIENMPPIIQAVEFSPNKPYTDGDLVCTVKVDDDNTFLWRNRNLSNATVDKLADPLNNIDGNLRSSDVDEDHLFELQIK